MISQQDLPFHSSKGGFRLAMPSLKVNAGEKFPLRAPLNHSIKLPAILANEFKR